MTKPHAYPKSVRGPARLSTPKLSARISAAESASVLARLIASGTARTRADLVRETGLARSTVAAGLSDLVARGLLTNTGPMTQTGRGRPGDRLHITAEYGLIAAVEIDRHQSQIALYDFGQNELVRFISAVSVGDDPRDAVAGLSAAIKDAVVQQNGPGLRMVVVGVAALVDIHQGTVAGPPALLRWEDFPFADEFADRLQCPTIVRNESDLRALGEARSLPADQSPLVYVRVDEGIGAGFTDRNGELFTGVDGAAGEISHMRTQLTDGVRCTCGGYDHVIVHCSLEAMLERWRASNSERALDDRSDFERALRMRDFDAMRISGDAARVLASALSDLLLILNPARITLGGMVVHANETFLAAIRAVIYENGLALATRNLTIAPSELGEQAGLRGALVVGLEAALAAEHLVDDQAHA